MYIFYTSTCRYIFLHRLTVSFTSLLFTYAFFACIVITCVAMRKLDWIACVAEIVLECVLAILLFVTRDIDTTRLFVYASAIYIYIIWSEYMVGCNGADFRLFYCFPLVNRIICIHTLIICFHISFINFNKITYLCYLPSQVALTVES